MAKIAPRALKIGVQSHFHPISTVGFRTFSPENFGQAYCACVQKISERYIRKIQFLIFGTENLVAYRAGDEH